MEPRHRVALAVGGPHRLCPRHLHFVPRRDDHPQRCGRRRGQPLIRDAGVHPGDRRRAAAGDGAGGTLDAHRPRPVREPVRIADEPAVQLGAGVHLCLLALPSHPPERSGCVAVDVGTGIWVLLLEPTVTPYPPTYFNNWLWAHVGLGKVFLGFCLMGTGLAGVLLLRKYSRFEPWFRLMPADAVVDHVAWRFMLLAFVFHSAMLIAGAVWAQDAWGRYWSWDALETSSFLTWLALGAAIHARLTYRLPMRAGAVFIIIVFVVAFLTYFGTPFYSAAAHKGVI